MAEVLGGRAVRQVRLLLSVLKPGNHVPYAGPAAAFGTSVTSAKVAVNGVHLHYQRTGEGEHAVLLLPGMLGSGETDFGPQIKNLNKKLFTVVAWDPRGYGHSRPPDRDFPLDFFERDAKDAVDLMKTLKFKKVSLLGWSDGGITALIAAARYPSYINKMVIWGANAYVTEEDETIYQGIRDVSKWSERTRKPLETLYGEYLSALAAPGSVPHLNRAWGEGSSGPTFPCQLHTQTCERVTVAFDARRQTQPASTFCK
ncbi:valacyclovir hydrolase isoform X4 [Panthera uncia]|uniref:valacyclovir hydrolase isoform X4 n=1 Tax=Panthera uncia TaxID=29064 RepID=UPI0020FF7E17|nr:valacyclovir hydrolase isoform X4 [Panthera uncia]